MEKKKKREELTKDEIQFISKVLYDNRWSGQEWQQVITPLINKLASMIDNFKIDNDKQTA